MEGLFFFAPVVAVIVGLDVLADRFGVDSWSAHLDDWLRSVTT